MKPILFLMASFALLGAERQTLNVPTTHPRLWWTPERLAQARAWPGANRFVPSGDDYAGQAFRYLLTGDASYARSAINFALGRTISERELAGTASDQARWIGEQVILIFDWTYDQMTQAERQTLIDRWNGYLDTLRQKRWGGPTFPQNNYYWGYLRNELSWAIATYYENPKAEAFLESALKTRWQESFLPHASTTGRGGVPQEGSQYGRYLLRYPVVPFTTAALAGRDLFGETDFFKAALFYVIYSTAPAPTALRNSSASYYEVFPSNDDEMFRRGRSAQNSDYADFVSAVAQHWRNLPLGGYARQWLKMTGATPSSFIAAVDSGGPARDFASLPLDYYAPGPQWLWARNEWSAKATVLHVQLGSLAGVGHFHNDYGNWQMWRNGRWLSRETTAYSENVTGFGGSGTARASSALTHNSLLINGAAFTADSRTPTPPVTRRLESRPAYAYAAVDLSPAYVNNPAAAHVEREFVFVRPLETLVILDRVKSAGNATKTFLAHFEQEPAIQDGNHVLAANGKQALRLTTLVPPAPSYRVVAEGGAVGQHRLEVDTRGQEQSYFLHVLQGRDAGGEDLEAAVTETGTAYTVTLSHPALGHARLVFQKGMASSGGGFAYSASGPPAETQSFAGKVQGIQVTDKGPVWEGSSSIDVPKEFPRREPAPRKAR